jgi:molybdate transport system permease protein
VAARAPRGRPLVLLGGLLALYLAWPLVGFVVRLAQNAHPGFTTPGLFGALATSAVAATIATTLIAVFGIPLAYVLARSRGRLASFVGFVVTLPLALPPLMSGILLIYVVGPYTALGTFFGRALTDSLAGIVLAQTFVAAPFLVIVARASFTAIDPALFDLAAGLGRGELARFLRVAVPVAGGGLRAGLLLAWLRAFGEFGATVILAFHPYSLPVYTYLQFSSTGLSTTEAPTALALALAAFVVAASGLHVRPRRRRIRLPSPAPPPAVAGEAIAFDLDLRLGDFHLAVRHAATRAQLAILGPSGSGKTATLRSLAGLFGAQAGSVSYGASRVEPVATERRQIGYVPQGAGLFPHLTVWRQLTFGVGADPGLAVHWLARLGLDGLENRLPDELSGGQRQRVALAQALARAPRLLLLDEPFAALDAPVRAELRRELRRLQQETGIASVIVTHDAEEAALLAEEILVLIDGRIVQAGLRREVFDRPRSPQVARLLGVPNLLPGEVKQAGRIVCGEIELTAPTGVFAAGAPVFWRIAPELVQIGAAGLLEASIEEVLDLGTTTEVALRLGPDLILRARDATAPALAPGERCRFDLPPAAIAVLVRR